MCVKQTKTKQYHTMVCLNYYLNYGTRGKVHLNDKHDGDPDDRTDDHEPAQNH